MSCYKIIIKMNGELINECQMSDMQQIVHSFIECWYGIRIW